MDLVLDVEVPKLRPFVAGTTPWLKSGPLSLRVYVAAGCFLEQDIPIPGDGIVNLPPLPVPEPTLCLVDGSGQLVFGSVASGARFQVPKPATVSFAVCDEAAQPLPGARVLDSVAIPVLIERPFRAPPLTSLRVVGTADRRGEGVALVPQRSNRRPKWLLAQSAGHGAAPSGWWRKDRVEAGRTAGPWTDGVSLHFVMQKAEPRRLHVVGAGRADVVASNFAGHSTFRGADGRICWPIVAWPATGAGADLACEAPLGGSLQARVTAFRDAGIPTRLWGVSGFAGVGERDGWDDLDLSALRPVAVAVVDGQGKPVPFAQVAVGTSVRASPVRCFCSIVTNRAGRAMLHVPADAGLVYARGMHAHGMQVLPQSTERAVVRVELAGFAEVPVTVVDRGGNAIAGARFETERGSYAVDSVGRVRMNGGGADPLQRARTDGDGRALLRVPVGFRSYSVRVFCRDGHSEAFDLPLGGGAATVRIAR